MRLFYRIAAAATAGMALEFPVIHYPELAMTIDLRCWIGAALLTLASLPALAQDDLPGEILEATTASGDQVLLRPNGRWEYVDAQKAQAAKEIAQQYPENKGCPPGWRGGIMGVGRCIPPTDKDFYRGSMIGK
jgi:hypothetical protein